MNVKMNLVATAVALCALCLAGCSNDAEKPGIEPQPQPGQQAKAAPNKWDGTSKEAPESYDSNNSNQPVEISTAAQLAWLAEQSKTKKFSGYTFNLTNDIDLNNKEWTPIGSGTTFQGIFNGQGHTVSNLKCTTSQQAGLFGKIQNATVQDVTASGSISYDTSNDSSTGHLGGIAAYVQSSTIENCINQCSVTATGNNFAYVGGIAGQVYVDSKGPCTLTGNTNTGTVTAAHASSYVGGIIGNALTSVGYITLKENKCTGGAPPGISIGHCLIYGGSITIDGTQAKTENPYPVTDK